MKKHWTLICGLMITFFVIAGFIFGANRGGVSLPQLPQLPGTASLSLNGMSGIRQAVLKVTSVSITPEYRKVLPQDADLDEKAFTPGMFASGIFMFSKNPGATMKPVIVSMPLSMPLVELQGNTSNRRVLKGNLFLETGGEMIDSPGSDLHDTNLFRNRSRILKNEVVRLSPSKERQDLIVQSSYYNESNELVGFTSQFEVIFEGGNNSRVFVSILQNQFGLDKKLWKTLQLDGEFAVRAKRE